MQYNKTVLKVYLILTAILMAEYMVVPEYFILRLGWAYIILRVIYGICYLSNWATLRSIVWFYHCYAQYSC